jgi:hypothetical protein
MRLLLSLSTHAFMFTLLGLSLNACDGELSSKDAYFGTSEPISVEGLSGEERITGGDAVGGNAMMGDISVGGDTVGGASMGGTGNCTPVLTPSGDDRSNAPSGCEEGCADLARCAIEEGECPGLASCDRDGVIDACLAICSEQLLAVFSTLGGCGEVIGLANQGLGESFANACSGD